jgi:hypothetical protein
MASQKEIIMSSDAIRSLVPNYGPGFHLVDPQHLSFNGKIFPLLGNIADKSHEIKQGFIKYLQISEKHFFSTQGTPAQVKSIYKDRILEVLKKVAPDAVINAIYVVARTTGTVVLMVIGFKFVSYSWL